MTERLWTFENLGLDLRGIKPTKPMLDALARFNDYEHLYETLSSELVDKEIWSDDLSGEHMSLLGLLEDITQMNNWITKRLKHLCNREISLRYETKTGSS